MRSIAIFDVDGTIFRSSLAIELFKVLVKKGVFEANFMKKVSRSEEKWMNRQGHYDDFVADVVEAYQKAIIGKKRDDIVEASRKVISTQKYRTYRYTHSLLQKIRGGYTTIGISGSPLEVLLEYNKLLKFDKLYGWEFGIDEKGRYTDVILHVPPKYKKELIVRYVQNHGLSFKGSIGVGDTESDVGFLELVQNPIAFNPNSNLAEIAKKKGWKVVMERKDLVLEFKFSKVKILKV